MLCANMRNMWSEARFITSVYALFTVFHDRTGLAEKSQLYALEKYLNIYSPFGYLLFEITGAHRIIWPLFDAWL